VRSVVLPLVVACLILGGCAASTTPAPTPTPSSSSTTLPTAQPSAVVAASSPSAPAGPAGPSASPSASSGPTVPIDPLLLAVLPSTVAGQTISEIPEIEANLMTDPDLVANAASLAVALGINSGTGDFAYIAVIQLKPLVFSNSWYLSWRQSYDQGACSQSNGLKSTTSAMLGGWQVFEGLCQGGALTYHVHLTAPDRIVSITSVGSAGYGAIVAAGLKP
jgi:hypothetical protein